MLLGIALLILGLVMLYYGADCLVRGAGSLALNFGISPLVAGLTVVAYGTSLPELVVSVRAAFLGESDLALGNVVGSNIFNVGVILGIAALLQPLKVELRVVRFDIPLMIVLSLIFAWLLGMTEIGRLPGALLVAALILFTAGQILLSKRVKQQTASEQEARALSEIEELPEPSGKPLLDTALIIVGILMLAGGAEALVRGAVTIARGFGVSEAVIGLTIVAAGTSAPELATTVVAALRKQADIAVGNIVGSNIFNILSVIGFAALIHPMQTMGIAGLDIGTMLLFAIILLPLSLSRGRINRLEGGVLLAFYALYLYLILPGSPGIPGLPILIRPA